jgi:hypothetical protein
MSDVNHDSRSAFVYACYHSRRALDRVKERDDEVHDGCGEDGVVHELYSVLAEAINYFDSKYLDEGAWNAGVYDYEVWDVDSQSAKLMYELLVMRAIRDAMGYGSNFLIGTIADIVDAYAASNGWKPGAGGE